MSVLSDGLINFSIGVGVIWASAALLNPDVDSSAVWIVAVSFGVLGAGVMALVTTNTRVR